VLAWGRSIAPVYAQLRLNGHPRRRLSRGASPLRPAFRGRRRLPVPGASRRQIGPRRRRQDLARGFPTPGVQRIDLGFILKLSPPCLHMDSGPPQCGPFFFSGRARVTARVFGSCPNSSGGCRASSSRSAARSYAWQSRNQARRAMPPGRSKRRGNCRTSAPCPFAGARRSLSSHHRSRTGRPTIHRQRTAPSSAGRKPRRP
jgi:hypothetical protein